MSRPVDTGGQPFVHQLVHACAHAAPGDLAVRDPRGQVTFGELAARANRLARRLRGLGAQPDTVVGVHLPRGADLVTAALGVLTAEAAYLPIDPANPPNRVAQLLTEAKAPLVVSTSDQATALGRPGIEVVGIDRLDADACSAAPTAASAETRLKPQHLAYVIYTSGSTGTPKGVMVPHSALSNMVRWNIREFGLAPGERTTMTASPGFDASVWEVWPTLAAGASLHVPDDETRLSPQRLRDWLVGEQITVTFLPTPLAELVLGLPWPCECRLRVLQTAGDRLHSRPSPALPFRTVNNYGPAENAVVATAGTVPPRPTDALPSIGRPVSGVDLLLLDADLRPVGPGDVGEIHLGGAGLARGYLHRPGLTAASLVPDPRADHPGGRLYRTGDLARRSPSGELDFRGRIDDQVKIRGNRVEPAEVTAALLEHPDVAQACTVVHADPAGDRRLVSYFVPATIKRIPAVARLQGYLAERLPDYLVPDEFVLFGSLPLTANGKVDRTALPAPRSLGTGTPRQAPRTRREVELASIWRDVFGHERIGVHDRFFDLGGHSLTAARLTARIRERLGLDVGVAAIFSRPTIAELAKELDAITARDQRASLPPLRRVPRQPRMPLSLVQEQVWFLTKLEPGTAAYHAQATIRVAGPLDITVLDRVLTEIFRRHESLRTVFGETAGRPWQAIRDPQPFRVAVVDLRRPEAAVRDKRVDEIVAREMRRPFDLSRLPLARWTAIRLADEEWELVVIEHHFIHDGWSFGRLMGEVRELYRAFIAGAPSPLPEPPVHYLDFACWQRAALDSAAMRARLDYWRERLWDAPTPLTVPTGRPRSQLPSGRGQRQRVELPPALPDRIRAFSRQTGVSLFMTLLAGFAAFLHRLTGVEDFCVGSAVANRRFPEIEPLLGMFVNNVVLRLDTSRDPSFRGLAGRVRDVVLAASANQDVPFTKVVSALNPSHGRAGTPFFRTMFSFHDSLEPALDFAGSPATVYELHNGTAKVDLEVVVLPRAERQIDQGQHRDGRITLLWDYDLGLLDGDTVAWFAERYQRMLDAALLDPELPLSQLPC